MFESKKVKVLQKWIDDCEAENGYLKNEIKILKKSRELFSLFNPSLVNSNTTQVVLKDNSFPKAVLATLVATHGIDSNDCKNHQRDRDNVMSGIMGAISVGNKEFHLGNKLNKYVIAELIEAGYDIECDDYGTIIRWDNAYLTP